MPISEQLKYKWLKLELFLLTNFGASEFKGMQFFKLRIVPKQNVKNQYLLQQHYNTYTSWCVGPFFILLDERE